MKQIIFSVGVTLALSCGQAWAHKESDEALRQRLQQAIQNELAFQVERLDGGSIEFQLDEIQLDSSGLRTLSMSASSTVQVDDIGATVDKALHLDNPRDGTHPTLTLRLTIESNIRTLIGPKFDQIAAQVSIMPTFADSNLREWEEAIDYGTEIATLRYSKGERLEQLTFRQYARLDTSKVPAGQDAAQIPIVGIETAYDITAERLQAYIEIHLNPGFLGLDKEADYVDLVLDRMLAHQPGDALSVDIQQEVKRALHDICKQVRRLNR